MSKKFPLISVIVPAYNEEDYIEECIKSLLKQSLPKKEYEILIIDNASTDNTIEIVKKYPVKLISEPKRSVVIARQTGVKNSQGEIIASADADTVYPPNWLKRIKEDFKEQPKIIGVAGWLYFKNSLAPFNYSVAITQEVNLFLQRLFGKFPLVYAANFAFKRSALNEIGGYPAHLPELGDQQYILYNFQKIGKVIIDYNLSCITSSRRHSEKWKVVVIHNGWFRIIGYLVNKFLGRQVIGPAPAIRTIPARKSHS